MRAAFYKGKKRIFNRLVCWWTRGKYSHMELVFSDGLSASSSFIDGGVRYKHIEYSDANWDFVELDCDESKVRQFIDLHLGQKYDVLGIAGFVLGPLRDGRKKQFCSELCMSALGYAESWRFSPSIAYVALGGSHE